MHIFAHIQEAYRYGSNEAVTLETVGAALSSVIVQVKTRRTRQRRTCITFSEKIVKVGEKLLTKNPRYNRANEKRRSDQVPFSGWTDMKNVCENVVSDMYLVELYGIICQQETHSDPITCGSGSREPRKTDRGKHT